MSVSSSVFTARLPSGENPIEKLEKGGNTPKQSAKCVLHALKAVRDGEDPSSAIKNYVDSCSKVTETSPKDTDANEMTKLSSNLSRIIVSEHSDKDDSAVAPDSSFDAERADEMEALREENKTLKEAFEALKMEHQAKTRECISLSHERDRLSKH